jgi:hypothetical protein
MEMKIVVPEHNTTLTDDWLTHPHLRTITERDANFQTALKIYRTKLSKLNLETLRSFVDKSESITYYFDAYPILYIEESASILKRVLILQMPDCYKEFISFLYELLMHESGKFNCLFIKGPPSVGKTWFASLVGKLMINTGYIGNSNRFSLRQSYFKWRGMAVLVNINMKTTLCFSDSNCYHVSPSACTWIISNRTNKSL